MSTDHKLLIRAAIISVVMALVGAVILFFILVQVERLAYSSYAGDEPPISTVVVILSSDAIAGTEHLSRNI